MKLAAILYLRVSTIEQAKRGMEPEGFSIPAQREACQRRAAQLEAEVACEFVDRGESARSANRPDLKRLLAYIAEHDVRYVIVHKIDRLARNLADHVEITLAIRKAGAELISVAENIDDTPLGEYMQTIFAANAQLYSANLAAEAKKGLTQKAKQGGTPGTAPLGYLNVRKVIEGYEVRTVEIDRERSPHIRWAFAAYGSGAYTLDTLRTALERRGLTTRPSRKKAAKPVPRSSLARLLANPYYIGRITWNGVAYEGRHEPLIDGETFQRVQSVLRAHAQSGEKDRKHRHYLKGTLYCAYCGSRLTFVKARGNGGTYPYFACIGRVTGTGCQLPYLPAEQTEDRVTTHWRKVRLPKPRADEVRERLGAALTGMRSVSEQEAGRQRRRLVHLERERDKLLQAFYADAIPVEQLKREQDRIARDAAAADRQLEIAEQGVADVEHVLNQALELAERCSVTYAGADPATRRQWNQAFFERLNVSVEDIDDERAPPFKDLTDPQLYKRLGQSEAPPAKRPSRGDGSKERHLVGAAGFEPTTSSSRTMRATRLRYAPISPIIENLDGLFYAPRQFFRVMADIVGRLPGDVLRQIPHSSKVAPRFCLAADCLKMAVA